MNEENTTKSIQTVDRAFQILETISEKGAMSLNDLHKIVGVNKASLHRLIYTLIENGYLKKDEQQGKYYLTLKLYEIGSNSIQIFDKMSLINTVLADLNDKTGRIAQYSVEDNNHLVCIQSIGQKSPSFSIYTNVGKRSPLYATSAGKAILAAYTNAEVLQKWNSFEIHQLTEHTIMDPQALIRDLTNVRQRQYALDMEENEYNVFCIGSVVLGNQNQPVGAISLSGRSMTPEEEQKLAAELLPATRLLSDLLGHVSSNFI
nr:IclR family transcriptional regulator [uncultured Blautia sp.]